MTPFVHSYEMLISDIIIPSSEQGQLEEYYVMKTIQWWKICELLNLTYNRVVQLYVSVGHQVVINKGSFQGRLGRISQQKISVGLRDPSLLQRPCARHESLLQRPCARHASLLQQPYARYARLTPTPPHICPSKVTLPLFQVACMFLHSEVIV